MNSIDQIAEAHRLGNIGRRGVVAAVLTTGAMLLARGKPALADQTISDNLIVTGSCKAGASLGPTAPHRSGPLVLKQISGNNGIVVTDEGGANRKDLFVGLDLTLSHAHIQAVQEGIAFLDTAINPSGGNVGIRTTAPMATLHVAGTEQVDSSLTVSGNLTVSGTKSRAVQTATHDVRKLYALEMPENWFEDIGWATLRAGLARVDLDAIFVETVNTGSQYASS